MWQGRAQSRCRLGCGRGEPSPGADVDCTFDRRAYASNAEEGCRFSDEGLLDGRGEGEALATSTYSCRGLHLIRINLARKLPGYAQYARLSDWEKTITERARKLYPRGDEPHLEH